MTHHLRLCIATLAIGLSVSACGGSGWRPAASNDAETKSTYDATMEAVAAFEAKDPSMKALFSEAHAYAVYPNVGKGGAWVGGAYGRGVVYRAGQPIGTTSVTQLTAGAQIGGQAYSEIVFFRDEAALNEFMEGQLELGAQASAVAVTAGAATNASYDRGVAIFTSPKGGFMVEASIAGQSFTFDPVKS